jgi:hypothetical protein
MVKPFGVMCPMFNYFGQLQNIEMDDRSHMDGFKKALFSKENYFLKISAFLKIK